MNKGKTLLRSDQIRRYVNTTAYWNAHATVIPKEGDIYIYSDGASYEKDGDTVTVPRMKAGDGVRPLSQLPFVDDFQKGTLTIKRNNEILGSFPADSPEDKEINISVPVVVTTGSDDAAGIVFDMSPGEMQSEILSGACVMMKYREQIYYVGYCNGKKIPIIYGFSYDGNHTLQRLYIQNYDMENTVWQLEETSVPAVNDATITLTSNSESLDSFTLNAASGKTIDIPDTDFVYIVSPIVGPATLVAASKKGQTPVVGYHCIYFPEDITVPAAGVNVKTPVSLNIGTITDKKIFVNGISTNVAISSCTFHQGLYLAYYNGYNWYLNTDGKLTINGKQFGGSYDDLTDKPTIPAAQVNSDWNASSGVAQILNKPTIPSAPGTLVTNATTSQTASSGEDMSGTISLHKVSKTGSYSDLNDKPTIPSAQVNSDWTATSGVAEILHKPTIPTITFRQW